MKKNYSFIVALLIGVIFFSCSKKKEDIDPIGGGAGAKNGRYMPLAVGNSWTYESNADGKYTGVITGKTELTGKEYYVMNNTVSGISYMQYEGNKFYVTVGTLRMLMLDEDARLGQEWQAGKIETKTEYYTSSVSYVGKYIAHHDTYTVEGVTYKDVVEIQMTTSSSVKFTQTALNLLDQETRNFMENTIKNAMVKINQRTFYAKNVGFIFQYSDDMPALGSKLLEYSLK